MLGTHLIPKTHHVLLPPGGLSRMATSGPTVSHLWFKAAWGHLSLTPREQAQCVPPSCPLPHPVQGLPPSFIYGLSLAASSTPSAHPGCPPEVWAQLGTLDWQVQHLPESMYMWWVKGGWVCSARLGPAQLVRWQGHGPILPISAPSGPLEVPEYRQRLNTTKTSHSVPQGREGLLKTQI